MTTPTSFKEVDPKFLRQTAVEDWAVEVKTTDSLKKVIEKLEEAGVFWEDYAAKYEYTVESTLDEPDSVEPVVVEREVEATREGDVVSVTKTETVEAPAPAFLVAEPVQAALPSLVKMIPPRQNVRYDVRGYTFTKEHPYALVKPQDLEYVLTHEEGFRVALPSEAQEFYN